MRFWKLMADMLKSTAPTGLGVVSAITLLGVLVGLPWREAFEVAAGGSLLALVAMAVIVFVMSRRRSHL